MSRIRPEERRKFLLKHLGAARLKQVEDALDDPALPGQEEEFVKGFKQDMAAVMETAPFGGATSWQQAQAYEDAGQLWAQFSALLDNIRYSTKPPVEQGNLAVAAAEGLVERLSGLPKGGKGLQERETDWEDSIYESLAELNPTWYRHRYGDLGLKQRDAASEFAEAMEDADPWCGPYLGDLARLGAVKQ
jgi:hypothetical protein